MVFPRASDPKVDSTFGIDPMLDPLSGASFFAENRVHLSARCAELCRLVRLKLRGLQENLPFLVVAPALPQWNCSPPRLMERGAGP
jgi:hypothetical protein